MKRRIEYFSLALFIALFSLLSCTNEELPRTVEPKGIEYNGEEVPLNIEADLEEPSSLRSVNAYEGINKVTLGRNPHLVLPDTVPVRVFVRKKGDEANTLSSVVLNGIVTKNYFDRYKITMIGTIKLRQPSHSFKEGEWQILATIGGLSVSNSPIPSDDQDAQPADANEMRHWVFPTSEWNPTVNAGSNWVTKAYDDEKDKNLSTLMPWMTDWQKLNTEPYRHIEKADGYGENTKLRFKPRGILLRAKSRNNMVFDLKIARLDINNTSRDLYFGGYFDMTVAGDTPVFKSTDKINHSVGLDISNKPLVPSGQEMKETVYVWAMPSRDNLQNVQINMTMKAFRIEKNTRDIAENSRSNEIYLVDKYGLPGGGHLDRGKETLTKNENAATTVAFNTNLRLQSVSNNFTYTLYPILTSQIFITENVVRPNVSNSNGYAEPRMADGYKSAWGALELYNPTLTPVNLAEYGIMRVTSPDNNGGVVYRLLTHPTALNKTEPAPDPKDPDFFRKEYRIGKGRSEYDFNRALVQSLDFVPQAGSTRFDGTPMPEYTTQIRTLYNTQVTEGKTMLMPGKTIVILDASYVRYDHTTPDNINIDDVGSIGVQLKHAVELGHTQAVVALDNAKVKNKQQDFRDSDGPVMYGGTYDGYYLVRKINGKWVRVDDLGESPQFNTDTGRGTVWTGYQGTMYQSRRGRDGNVRTSMSVVLDPTQRGGWYWNTWVFTPSIEDNDSNDYINNFMNLGSRFWLGPTEKSREAEWNIDVESKRWKEPGQRNWELK